MRFSILHVSDLHRDSSEETTNDWLLDSLERDFAQHQTQNPKIIRPSLCVVTGDLVYGIKPGEQGNDDELVRQYRQAEEFLVGLADRFFSGNRDRVVVLPGNHDVSYDDVLASSVRVEIPATPDARARLVAELLRPRSHLRWSWGELCFFRIIDTARYRARLQHFAATYGRFYQQRRMFSDDDGTGQTGIFDFPEFGLSVIALNSCHENDPMRRRGAFHPGAVTEARRAALDPKRTGWLIAGAWHHSLFGGPNQDDYIDAEVLQPLIDAGVSLAFHGHQHRTECIDERYRIGPSKRSMTLVSAGTLCAGSRYLPPGEPRSYNVVELDTTEWRGRVHQRKMVNRQFEMPVWGPGHFETTNDSHIDFDLCKPLADRPPSLDVDLVLERADRLLGARQWDAAVALLETVKDAPVARPLMLKALTELGDARRMIDLLLPPQTIAEAVSIGGAVLDGGTRADMEAFLSLDLIRASTDASVREISRRIRERQTR